MVDSVAVDGAHGQRLTNVPLKLKVHGMLNVAENKVVAKLEKSLGIIELYIIHHHSISPSKSAVDSIPYLQ